MYYNPYENLAMCVIIRAIKDYKRALETIDISERDPRVTVHQLATAYQTKEDCESFFRSEWFDILAKDSMYGTDVMNIVRRHLFKPVRPEYLSCIHGKMPKKRNRVPKGRRNNEQMHFW